MVEFKGNADNSLYATGSFLESFTSKISLAIASLNFAALLKTANLGGSFFLYLQQSFLTGLQLPDGEDFPFLHLAFSILHFCIFHLQQYFLTRLQLPDREDRRVFWNKPEH